MSRIPSPPAAWQRTVASAKTALFWRIFAALLGALLFLQWLAAGPYSRRTAHPHHAFAYNHHSVPMQRVEHNVSHWSFDWKKHGKSYVLSSDQCETAFPDLYYEIDRAANYWSSRTITSESIELTKNSGVRARILNGELHLLKTSGLVAGGDFRARILAVLHQIQRALDGARVANETVKDTEFTVIVDDFPDFPERLEMAWWTWTRNMRRPEHDALWLVPDFNFWAIPPVSGPFGAVQDEARQHDRAVADKIPQAVWRGVTWTNPPVREALMRQTEHQAWANVKVMSWDQLRASEVMKLGEFCDYAFLINTEGRAWSSRLTYGLNCDSVSIVHDLEWNAHFYHLLWPGINHIGVKRDFSDLGTQMEHYLKHPEKSQVVADNARKTFRERYTTPAAGACYWRKVLRAWSEVAADIVSDRSAPSITFEEFVVKGNSDDFPERQV